MKSFILPTSCIFLLLVISQCPAQETQASKLDKSLPNITLAPKLPKTLLEFSDKSHIDVVADTTTQADDIDIRKPVPTQDDETAGQFISEQGPVYGYYWNALDEDSVLIWPKPDIVPIAQTLTAQWQQQRWTQTDLPDGIKSYFAEVARQLDEEGGEEKKDKSLYYSVRPKQLSEEKQNLLLPLSIQALRQYSIEHSQSWFNDDFWRKAQISIARFDGKDRWFVSGTLNDGGHSGRGLTPPMPEGTSYIPWGKSFAPDARVNLKSGDRGVAQMPATLAKKISLRIDNSSIADTLGQISKLAGYSVHLDDATDALTKNKRVTIDVSDVAVSTLLHDIALLFDLQWTQKDNTLIAVSNTDSAQNMAAKIGCLACLGSWKSFSIAQRPNWDDLFAQETTAALAKKGLPLSGFSPEVQKPLRDYCQEDEASQVLEVWLNTEGSSLKNPNISWRVDARTYRRNTEPMPDHQLTNEEANDAKFMADFYAKYYNYGRPYTVTIGEPYFHYNFLLPLNPPVQTAQTP